MKRNLCILVITCLLAACGGGGGGGSSGGKATDSSRELSVAAYGYSIKVSSSSLAYNYYLPETNTSLIFEKTLHVSFVGDGVNIDFPNNEKPSWITLSRYFYNTNSGEGSFDLNITIDVTDYAAGKYSTYLRFITGKLDGNQHIHADLPITINLKKELNLFGNEINFQSTNSSLLLPEMDSIIKSGNTTFDYNLTPGNTNTTQKDWYSYTSNSAGIDYSITKLLPAGEYQADNIISYVIGGFYGEEHVSVNYSVEAAAPKLHYIFPANLAIGEKTELIIRGVGFNHITSNQISINNINNPVIEIVNDTTIHIKHDGFVSNGVQHITLTSDSSQDITLTVKPYISIDTYEIIDYSTQLEEDSYIQKMVFNELEDAIYIIYTYPDPLVFDEYISRLLKYKKQDGAWIFDGKYDLESSVFELMPDKKEALIVSPDNYLVSYIDLDSMIIKRTIDFFPITPKIQDYFWSSMYIFGWYDQPFMMNNGEMVVRKPIGYLHGGNVWYSTYSTYNTVNQTVSHTDLAAENYGPILVMDYSHSKTLIFNGTIIDSERFAGYYDSSTSNYHIFWQPDSPVSSPFTHNSNYNDVCNYGDSFVSSNKFYETDTFNNIGSVNLSNTAAVKFTNDCAIGYAFPSDNSDKSKMYIYDTSTLSSNIYPSEIFLDFSSLANTDQIYAYGEIKYISPNQSFLIRATTGKIGFYRLNFL